ncbi:dihydrofolate reductase family protein [Psychromicrobium lacuslunae]|uniref:Deaminase n=1 Tax=Psychromicrobium lacuslunae TaxID=1618207 RepID=A0A0D4BXM0_9MICC|nr:dihydrofolate reductase family protein [Psychromicrobium lacuslunae]AJT41202.1 deaminase [Psychromicrobium lacuslunae]
MLLVSMGVSIDGYINDRSGGIGWTVPSDELFAFHLARVSQLGGCLLGRRMYQTMQVWETDPTLIRTPLDAEFAEVWKALPKVVFSRSLDRVEGNARLATGTLSEEIESLRASTDKDIEISGAELAGPAIEAGLVDELGIFRYPIIVGGGTPLLPAVPTPITLDLVESRVFSPNVIYERYRRANGSSAPSDGPSQ